MPPTTFIHIPADTQIPEEFDLLWNFSEKIDGMATGTITRKRDRAEISVLMDCNAEPLENLNALFPTKESEISAPETEPLQ